MDRGRAVPRPGGILHARPPRLRPAARPYGAWPAYRYSRPGYRYARPRYYHFALPGYRTPRPYGSWFYTPGLYIATGYGYGPYDYWGTGWGWPYGGSYYPYGGVYANAADIYTGFLRLKVRPREADVYIDGYFVGIVDDFDGFFQRVRLKEGPHTVELRHPGYEVLTLDVLIVPGEKVTFEGDLTPLP